MARLRGLSKPPAAPYFFVSGQKHSSALRSMQVGEEAGKWPAETRQGFNHCLYRTSFSNFSIFSKICKYNFGELLIKVFNIYNLFRFHNIYSDDVKED